MATLNLPEMPEPRMSSHLMVGVASPLWAYFGAAAAGGLAYWWMTQWTRPVNLEAMFGTAAGGLPLLTPVAAAAEAIVEAVEVAQAALEDAADMLPPVGGESAPVSPLLEMAPEPEPEPAILEAAPEPVIEAAPEPVVELASEPAVEAAPEPAVEAAPEPVVEVALEPIVEAAPEAVLEAAPEPVIEEPAPAFAEVATKPRGKKSAPPVVEGDA